MKGAASPDGREKRRTVTNGRRPDGDTRSQVVFTFAVNFTQVLMPQFATGCLPESRLQFVTLKKGNNFATTGQGWRLTCNLLPETLRGSPVEDINCAGNQERDGRFNPVWSPGRAHFK